MNDPRKSGFDIQRSAQGFAPFLRPRIIAMTTLFGTIFVVLALLASSIEFTGSVKPDTSPWALGFSATCAAVGAGDDETAGEHIGTALREADSLRFGDVRQSLTHALGSFVHAAQGRREDAKRSAERTLALLKYVGFTDLATDSAVSAVYELIGASYSLQKLWSEAEPMLVQSLKVKEATFDPGSGEIRAGIEQLASVYRMLGRSSEADDLCRRMPAAAESVDPNELSDAENLGECIELLRRAFGATYVGGAAGCEPPG